MLIQRGVLSCERCEKDGIPPQKQWLAPEWMVCLGCGDNLVKQTDCHKLPDSVVRLALSLCRNHMFQTEGMGSKTSFPGGGPIAREEPRLCLKSRIVNGLSAAITWEGITLDTNAKPGVSWDEFCRKHTDLLVPGGLEAAIKMLVDFGYSVTWNNMCSARKEIRLTRYKHTSGEHTMFEVAISWDVPEHMEQTARFYREFFGRYYGGGQAGTGVEGKTVHRQVSEAVATAIGHMWFGDCVTGKWWEGLWLNEAFAQLMGDRVAGQAAGNLQTGDLAAYLRGLAVLASLPPERVAQMLAAIKAEQG